MVRPPHAEEEARGLEAPGEKREAARVPDPRSVPAAGEQRGGRETERDGEGGKTRQHHWRMDQHPSVAQDRVEAESVWRRDGEKVERTRDHGEHEQEEAEDHRDDAGRVSGDPAAQ